MSHILGVKRKGRTASFFVAFFAISLLGLVVAPNAIAVHDVGVFQMDGNAQTSVQSTPNAAEDWDLICKAKPATCSFIGGYSQPAGATTAVAASHVNDGDLNATIFQGGGSKDPEEISEWRWKDGAGGLPDKDNLLHAYAARYSKPAATCPGVTTTTCELMYFGSDRYANDGDAQQAFWFFQSKIQMTNESANGGFKFSGLHQNGDLLIVSDFSNGGTTSTINIYKWLNGDLSFVTGGAASKCGGSSNDAFCGIVNESTTPLVSPWPFLDKDGSTSFRQGEFYEAGINLSSPTINLADECFSSFVAETRSSTSTTATLKDFVLGEFGTCSATMTTTPSAGAGGIVAPGVSVTDSAVVQGQGSASPPTPTGDVTFFLCGPIATGVCTSGGTNLGTGALGNSAPPTGEATATSPAVNTASVPLAAGRYCFRATWPGDTNYTEALSHTGAGDAECFTVQDTTSMTTAQNWLPNDSATITSGGGTVLNGTLSFALYNSLANCTAGTATGRLYGPESFTLTNAASPATRETTNASVKVLTTQSVWWRVAFASSSTNVVGVSASCGETTSLTITN